MPKVKVQPTAESILAAVATPKKAKQASDTPEFSRPELKAQTDRFPEVQAQIKSLETEKAYINSVVIPVAEDLRVLASLESGKSLSSVRVNGVTYVCQARFSDVSNPDEVIRLQEIPALRPYLRKRIHVTVHPELLTPEQAQQIAALRESGAVEVESSLEIDPSYLADRTLKGEVAEAHKIAGIKNVAFLRA